MIRVEGQTNQSHDPKLKLPIVSADRPAPVVNSGVTLELRSALDRAIARVDALEARVAVLEALPKAGNASPEGVTETFPPVTESASGNAGGNAPKLSAAEKQRAYRERRKAKVKTPDE